VRAFPSSSRASWPSSAAEDQGAVIAIRRVFIQTEEVPGLLCGALAGSRPVLRRLLGARRGGRWGLALAAAALLGAAPRHALAPLIALDLMLSALAIGAAGLALSFRQHQRLALWFVAPLAAAAVPLRLAWPGSALPAALAVVAAHAWLWGVLRNGLDDRAHAERDAG